jgi:hypothetical protein
MKNIKTFEQFKNEEVSWKNMLTGAALGAGLAFGTPKATGQEVNPIEVSGSYGVDDIENAEGNPIKDKELLNKFRDLLNDDRLEESGSYVLVDAMELKDEYSNIYALKVRKQNVGPGQGEFTAYINKEDFDKYLQTNVIDPMITYQFKEIKPIPDQKKFGL